MEDGQVKELLLQSLEHERGGVELYEAAVEAARNKDLKKEWEEYLEQTRKHVAVLERTLPELGIGLEDPSPGRAIVAGMGAALVEAVRKAMQGDPAAAELVACECVTLAETKDHLDWTLIGAVAQRATGATRALLQQAYDEVEDEEDEHLYHSKGWCRELWLKSLGLKAELPPPEEKKHVKSALAAARAAAPRSPSPHSRATKAAKRRAAPKRRAVAKRSPARKAAKKGSRR